MYERLLSFASLGTEWGNSIAVLVMPSDYTTPVMYGMTRIVEFCKCLHQR